jgi:hypothetical protein
MKNPDALRIFSPEFFGGKYKSLKKQQQTDYFVKMAHARNLKTSVIPL